jgi:DNA-binding NtrC family response regulator
MNTNLEKVINDKIIPIINSSTTKALGKPIIQFNEDITTKLKKAGNYSIDINKKFKDAKRQFKIEFLTNMIKKNCGNISEVARIVEVDRRSIHRIIDDSVVKEIREKLPKIYDLRYNEINSIIEKSFLEYKNQLSDQKVTKMYEEIPKLVDEIIKEIPIEKVTLKEAEIEFEKEYLLRALTKFNFDINKTAQAIGLRYETLFRKIKILGLGV